MKHVKGFTCPTKQADSWLLQSDPQLKSESHLAIHTWPEFGYAAVDLFTCGEQCDPKVSYEFLKRKFNSRDARYSQLNRGLMDADQVEHKSFLVSENF